MKAVLHTDPGKFWRIAGPIYQSDPIRHTVALTVLRGVLQAPNPNAERPVLITIEQDGDVVGAAFCTPPWPIGVSAVPDDGVSELVKVLLDNGFTPSGVGGPREQAESFATAWQRATGARKEHVMAQRCYRLGRLVSPAIPGMQRLATEADVPLLTAWHEAFAVDAGLVRAGHDHEDMVRRAQQLGDGQLIWEVDSQPVAHAAASAPINGMSRVGPVYTAPEHRNHGYGSAVTAAAAQWCLNAGAEDVVLFTDLANPTSNSIYQKIGFESVYDAAEYRFTEPATRD